MTVQEFIGNWQASVQTEHDNYLILRYKNVFFIIFLMGNNFHKYTDYVNKPFNHIKYYLLNIYIMVDQNQLDIRKS